MEKRRSLIHTTLSKTTSRKAFRFVSKDELARLGLNARTKLLVPKSQKRVTKKTVAIKPSELAALTKTRGAKREKAVDRVAAKLRRVETVATKQTVQSQKRRDARFEKTEKQARRAPPRKSDDFPAYFLERVLADAKKKTRIVKAGGVNKGAASGIVTLSSARQALDNRAKRLRNVHIPDGEYQAMMDYMAHYADPYYQLMRGSPDVKGSRISG